MTLEEKHNIFMTNAACCLADKSYCVSKNKQLGKQTRIHDLYELKLLYLLIRNFACYSTDCITAEDYNKVYDAITDICDFCNCNETITS